MVAVRPRTATPVGIGPSPDRPSPSRTRTAVRPAARRRPPVVIWLPAVLVAVVALIPLGYLAIRALEGGADSLEVLLRPRTARIALNSALLCATVALSTTLVAVPLAWLTTRTDLPFRRFWTTAAALPLVIPSYVGAVAIIAALGPKGSVQGWLAPLGVERLPSIYGFWGSWLALTLFTYPYVFLSVRAALRGLDPSLEEAARSLGHGPWRTFWSTTLPQLRPAIAAGALLVALYTLAEFGVVNLMRFDAFTRAIYVQYHSALDRSAAATLATLLVLLTLALLWVETRVRGRHALHRLGSGSARAAKPIRLGPWKGPALLFCLLVVGLALGMPLAVLVSWLLRTLREDGLPATLWADAGHSLSLGLWTAAFAALVGIPIAILAARWRGTRWAMLERLTYLGYVLPGIVIALAFVAFGVRTPFHQTLPLLIVAYVVRFLPEAVGSTRLSLLQINPRLEEAARSLGRTPARAAASVLVPLARPGVLTGAALVLLTTMKELPVTLLLSPTGYTTLATDIWTHANDAAYGKAAAPALLLIAVSAVPTLFLATRDRSEGA